MKLKLPFLFLFMISSLTYSQTNFNTKAFGVTVPDLKETHYVPDSTANAVVIYEKGESYVDKRTFYLTTKIERKIKIFNRNGFEYGTIEIPLYYDGPQKEKIYDVVATTHNLKNGTIEKTSLEKSEIFDEKYNDRFNILKFTFPNLQEGSVITYSYTKSTPFIYKYYPWDFQSEIPTLYSEYNTSIPANYDYNIKLVGTLPLDFTDQKVERSCLEAGNGLYADCTVSVYKMKNIPAFIEEEYMTTKENYLSRIEYELKTYKSFSGRVDNVTKSWKTADVEIESETDLGRQLKRTGMVKTLIDPAITSISDPLEKAKKIFYYVQENYTFNKKFNFLHDISLKNLLDERSGTVSEINILLHNLLAENDIDASPVLISTRDNGFVTQLYPVISEFNYLLIRAKINGKSYMLDASDKNLSFGEIPFKALNQQGRILDFKGESKWVKVEPELPSVTQQMAELTINDEGKFEGTFKWRTTGYHSLEKRIAYSDNRDKYIEDNKRDYTNPAVSNHEIFDWDRKNPMFVESFDITYTPETIGKKIYLDPFMYKNFKSNPFRLQDRTYPIDFGFKDSFTYSAKINLGEDYEIDTLPEAKNLALPNNTGTLMFNTTVVPQGIEIFFKFDFKEEIYPPNYYPYIKEFVSTLIETQNNTLIVLKKK